MMNTSVHEKKMKLKVDRNQQVLVKESTMDPD